MSPQEQESPGSGPPIDDTPTPPDAERCEAIADSTGERCKRAAIKGFPYCGLHKGLLDEVDIVRIGLNALESRG